MAYAKGSGPVSAKYAQGGKVFTTRSRFLKTPNPADAPRKKLDYDEKQGKGGTLSKTEGESKQLPAVKPHS